MINNVQVKYHKTKLKEFISSLQPDVVSLCQLPFWNPNIDTRSLWSGNISIHGELNLESEKSGTIHKFALYANHKMQQIGGY